ncbi:Tfp pilus assembly protein FimT [Clostridium baratii]|nr:type II secretion system protein [Clostridium baratii]CUP04607.1 Tfp pilus assembly protein FimT [Clostridium baratii]
MNKNKGFTLIELIAVIGITSIILLFGISGTNYYKKIQRDIETEEFIASFKHLLSESKMEAINRESVVVIIIQNSNKKIKSQVNLKLISSIAIPEYINNVGKTQISVSSDGRLESGTLIFENTKDKEKYFF